MKNDAFLMILEPIGPTHDLPGRQVPAASSPMDPQNTLALFLVSIHFKTYFSSPQDLTLSSTLAIDIVCYCFDC